MLLDKENLNFLYNLTEMLGVSIADVYIRKLIKSLNEDLNSTERDIIIGRLKDRKTLAEIGDSTGKGREEIRQIEALALRLLRGTMYSWYIPNLLGKKDETRKDFYKIKQENAYLKGVIDRMKESVENTNFNIASVDNRHISNLNLSSRSYNALLRAGIMSVSQLWDLNKADLYRIKNIGEKSINEVMTIMRGLGKEY